MVKDGGYGPEQAVIGSMLIDQQCCGLVFEKLRAEDFESPVCRNLFTAARTLFMQRRPVDPVTVLGESDKAYTELVGELMIMTPTSANVEDYAQIVKDRARLRELNMFGMQLAQAADYEEGLRILAKAEGLLTASAGRRASSLTDLVNDYLDRQTDGSKPNYIDWGIEGLNRNLSVSPGRFVILGADSSVGKTALALQLACNVARSGKKVGFFSYETSRADAADRIMANIADIALPASKGKRLSKSDFDRAYKAGEEATGLDLTVIESAEYTVDDIRAETLAGRFDMIFIDYIQLIPAPGGRKDRWQEVTAVSMALHSMAQRLGVTVLGLSQVTPPEKNRKGERPQLTKENLRESRQLLNDADVIMLMDLVDTRDRGGLRVLRVDKNKDGPLGELYLKFDPVHMRFEVSQPPRSESYKQLQKSLAELRREEKAAKSEKIAGQVNLHEVSARETGPLPF